MKEPAHIAQWRRESGVSADSPRWGLAFSSGGLRSAAFSLGVRQALAATPRSPEHKPLLDAFDYVSTAGASRYYWDLFRSGPATGNASGFTFALAQILRSWLASQIMLGIGFLLLFSIFALVLHLSTGHWIGLGRMEMDLLYNARQAYNAGTLPVWWSPSLLLAHYVYLPLLCLALATSFAYLPIRGHHRPNTARVMWATRLLACYVLLVLGAWLTRAGSQISALYVNTGTLMAGVLILAWFAGATRAAVADDYLARLTRIGTGIALIAVGLILLGAADTVARTIYLSTKMAQDGWPALILAALVALVAVLAGLAAGGVRISTAASLCIVFLNAVIIDLAVQDIRWNHREPVDWLIFGNANTTSILLALVLFGLIAAGIAQSVHYVNAQRTVRPIPLRDHHHPDALGIYDLLQPHRKVSFILACDCTADPDHGFAAYGRLVTLARRDLGLELVADTTAPQASPVFGGIENVSGIATLINVYPPDQRSRPVCRIALMKPRVTMAMSDDLRIQAGMRRRFTYAMQWEWYRHLGNVTARSVVDAMLAAGLLRREP